MSTVYDEGPYKNWTAIHFPSGEIRAEVFRVDPFFTNQYTRYVVFREYNGDELLLGGDPQKYKTVITGNTSGASVDLSGITPTAALGSHSVPSNYPTCTLNVVNFSKLPDGAPYTGVWPNQNATGMHVSIAPAVQTPGSAAVALLESVSGHGTGEPPGLEACFPLFDAIADIPQFIDGEVCTLAPIEE